MKIHNIFICLALLGVVSVSCKNEPDSPEEFKSYAIPYIEGTSERTYMEETASSLLGLFKPAEQSALIMSVHRFAVIFDTYEFPPEFGHDGDVAEAAESFARALEEGNAADIARATKDFAFTLSNYSGLYQANDNSRQWQRIEDASLTDFRYWVNGTENNIIVKGEGGTWTETVATDQGTYTVNVPKRLMVVLNQGVTSSTTQPVQRFMATIDTEAKDNDHFNSTIDITAENLLIKSNINATNSKYTERITLSVDDKKTYYRTTAIDASIEASGQGLCSIAAWSRGSQGDVPRYVGSMITAANTTIMIMGRIQVKAQISDFKTLLANTMHPWSTTDTPNARERAVEAASELSKCANAATYYAGSYPTKARAKSGWEAFRADEYGSTEVWGVRPTLTFTADDATYDIYGYFMGGGRFYTVETQIRNLLNTYKTYWK